VLEHLRWRPGGALLQADAVHSCSRLCQRALTIYIEGHFAEGQLAALSIICDLLVLAVLNLVLVQFDMSESGLQHMCALQSDQRVQVHGCVHPLNVR